MSKIKIFNMLVATPKLIDRVFDVCVRHRSRFLLEFSYSSITRRIVSVAFTQILQQATSGYKRKVFLQSGQIFEVR